MTQLQRSTGQCFVAGDASMQLVPVQCFLFTDHRVPLTFIMPWYLYVIVAEFEVHVSDMKLMVRRRTLADFSIASNYIFS